MTRDEAIAIECKKLNSYIVSGDTGRIAAANIDALIELGLLKVDEPKSMRTICIGNAADALNFAGSINDFEKLLLQHGLYLKETEQ